MFDSVVTGYLTQARPSLPGADFLRFGIPRIDGLLNGGLRRDGLHEFYAVNEEDKAATMAVALLLTCRACNAEAPLIWLCVGDRDHSHPYAPGLMELGLNSNTMLLMRLPDVKGLLRAAVDCVRHGGVGAVILQTEGPTRHFDLTASRRLTLAAERSGTLVLMVRNRTELLPSAAHTRWHVMSAPSAPCAANAPGHPVFDLTLLRQRGGRDGLHLQMEWDREQAVFRETRARQTPLSGGLSALSVSRAADQGVHRTA